MNTNLQPLALGLTIFSLIVTGIFVIPYINLLYRLKFLRRKEAPRYGKVSLFDKLHDIKAGTPVGGGILIITIVTVLFSLLFPFASHMGVYIRSSYNLNAELFVIFLTFISFGFLGLYDDLTKIFGKPIHGSLGMWFGLRRRSKFIIQCILATIISYLLWKNMGIDFVHIPLIDTTLHLHYAVLFIPFASFTIVAFSNAYNITDGLDGLAVGLLIICLIVFGTIAAGNLDTPLSLFIALWLGSLIAFAYFNVWPARIHLGDAGSLSFGAMLAVIGILTGNLVALLVVGGLFIIEVASSAIQMLGWKVFKRPLFPIAPLHHSFLAQGWEEPKIVMRAWLAGIVLAIFALWLANI